MNNRTAELSKTAYQLPADQVLNELGSDAEQGLRTSEAVCRTKRYGANTLEVAHKRPIYILLLHQFNDLLIGLLFVAAALAYYLDDLRGAIILLVIILLNAVIGFSQEYKADRLLEGLQALISARATVVRDGEPAEIEKEELVPGDIVLLEAGAAIPADLRLIESHEFATNDFTLTGESIPQGKDANIVVDQDVSLSDQDCLAFMGTTVARGAARGVVIATGMATAIGQIADISQTITRDRSPLQREIDTLARSLTKIAGVIVIAMFAANVLLRAEAFPDARALVNASLLFAIGVAAACVPQGLPAQITVALSLGIGRLARRSAVVKRLSAVETLGSTTIICSDKTGTITANEMTIVGAWANGRSFEVTGEGYDPQGSILENGKPVPEQDIGAIKQFFQHGLLASSGRTHPPDEHHPEWYALGDPTEAAFMPLAIKAGLDPEERLEKFPLLAELAFNSKRKRMTMVRSHNGRVIAYMKGATESVLDVCSAVHVDGKSQPIDAAMREQIIAKVEDFSAQALRVIALAYRDFPEQQTKFPIAQSECDFVFAGLVAMIDPPRAGVPEAIRDVSQAHVRIFMLTGDDPVTAAAIARRIGMVDGPVLTGDDLARLSDDDLKVRLDSRSLIISRVSPTDKYRIVKLLKQMSEVVAVTGDGVNDTLSLKQADIGVAMGQMGSDVAKEAAEIVLTDDNFATLVVAIREGRTIFQNLRSVILSSITSNIGELSCVCFGFVGASMGLPIPITAVQILSIDLIGEMLPLMALTFDPAEEATMHRRPRAVGAHIVNPRSLLELTIFGTLMGLSGYVSFYLASLFGASTGTAQAAAFAGIVLAQYVNILSRRSEQTVFAAHSLANPRMWQAIGISFVVVVTLLTVPLLGRWFGFEPMRPQDWIWPAGGALIYLFCFEARKTIAKRGREAVYD